MTQISFFLSLFSFSDYFYKALNLVYYLRFTQFSRVVHIRVESRRFDI